jgi:hypothetical protein
MVLHPVSSAQPFVTRGGFSPWPNTDFGLKDFSWERQRKCLMTADYQCLVRAIQGYAFSFFLGSVEIN